MKRLVKVFRDEEGIIKSYRVQQYVSGSHRPRGGEYLLLEADRSIKHPIINIIDDNPVIVEDQNELKKDQIKDLRKIMNFDINNEMSEIFGDTKESFIMSNISIWEAMFDRPANYIYVIPALDTEEKVINYASNKLNKIDEYFFYRLQRIKKFESDRQNI